MHRAHASALDPPGNIGCGQRVDVVGCRRPAAIGDVPTAGRFEVEGEENDPWIAVEVASGSPIRSVPGRASHVGAASWSDGPGDVAVSLFEVEWGQGTRQVIEWCRKQQPVGRKRRDLSCQTGLSGNELQQRRRLGERCWSKRGPWNAALPWCSAL
mgnify:CR=1 FL=1